MTVKSFIERTCDVASFSLHFLSDHGPVLESFSKAVINTVDIDGLNVLSFYSLTTKLKEINR
jgi:hypothetical protein